MLTLDQLDLAQGDFRLRADLTCIAGLTAIVGASGCGKSTLLSAIAGFLKPLSGEVRWQDRSLTGLGPGDRPISTLFQDNNLFPHLMVKQNLGLGLNPRLKLDAEANRQIDQILTDVELAGFGDRKPGALSGGQQSRVALARVLIAGRPLVLLDEPFAALGPALKVDMLTLVRDKLVAEGQTVLMVTHDPEDARRFADHVIVVADGLAHAPIPTETAFSNPSAALGAYLGIVP